MRCATRGSSGFDLLHLVSVENRNAQRDSDLKRIDLRAVSSLDQLSY